MRRYAALSILCSTLLMSGYAHSADTLEHFSFNNSGEPATLDPSRAVGVPERNILLGLFEGLTSYDPRDLSVQPGVAHAWKITEQGRRYTFFLRKEARWSDGVPVTAKDFVYAWKRLLEPKRNAPYAYYLFPIRGAREYFNKTHSDFSKVAIKILDPHRIEIELNEPTPYFLFVTGFYALAPLPSHAVRRWGAEWASAKRLVSNGPFRLMEWKANERIVLERDQRYWDRVRVRMPKIYIYPIESRHDVIRLYRDGKIQWTGHSALPHDEVQELRARSDFFAPGQLATYFMRINTKRRPFNHSDVRQALYLAIDRTSLVRIFTVGGEKAARSITPPNLLPYQPPAAPSFHPKKARYHLEKAGFCTPAKKKACKIFPAFEILINKDVQHRKIMGAIAEMWKQHLGIKRVSIKEVEWPQYLALQRSMGYDVARSGWVGDFPDASTFLKLFVKDGGNNKTGWGSDRFDRYIAEAGKALNPDQRRKQFRAAESVLLHDLPIIPLFHYSAPYLLDRRIGGFYPNMLDIHPLKSIYIRATVTASR